MRKEPFDAVVVGSGATGSWAAKTLTEGGMSVCVLDAGPMFQHYRVRSSSEEFKQRYPVQSKLMLCNPMTHQLWVDDIDNPYTTPADRPFDWFRGRIVGGRLRTWGRVCLRMSDVEFYEPKKDGYGIAWPIGHAELAPYYSEIERFMSITGERVGIEVVPDGDFTNPVCLKTEGFQRLAKVAPEKLGRKVIAGRVALTDGAEILSAAASTGRLTLRPNAVVHRVITEPGGGRATGVAFIDRNTKQEVEIHAKVVVLAPSAIETIRILLMSAPGGLGNSSGVLGRYVMDHLQANAYGFMPGVKPFRDALDVSGRGHLPRFRNVTDRHPSFIRGYGIDTNLQGMAFGEEEAQAYYWIAAMGEMLPREDNRVTLDPVVKDRWGLPAAHIDVTFGDNDRAMLTDMSASVAELVDALGFTYDDEQNKVTWMAPGATIHETGGARMGADPKTSYLDSWLQAWEVKNLYVVDGAVLPTVAWQNTTHTMMALALRASHHILEEAKRQNL